MKKTLFGVLLLVLLAFSGFAAAGGPGAGDTAAPAPAAECELHELGYWIFHLSTINALNGLNLDRDQLVKLRALAQAVERAGAEPPEAGAGVSPEMKEIRATFEDVRTTLLAGGEVSEAQRARVLKARTTESRMLRAGLTAPRRGFPAGACQRCHAESEEERSGTEPPAVTAAVKAEMQRAHSKALYGAKALVKMAFLARETDAVLTDAQRAVFSDFSCCLLPPKGLSDPVRVGQAAAADWTLDLLKKVRACPDGMWPAALEKIVGLLAKANAVKNPGARTEDEDVLRARVTRVLEKARGLSDVDFELAKEKLCEELTARGPQEDHAVKRAFFLLSPGSVPVYDELLRRLDRAPAAGTAAAPAPPAAGAPTAEKPT